MEVILAPDITSEALNHLSQKMQLRILLVKASTPSMTIHSIQGGLLIQEEDREIIDEASWKIVTRKQPTPQEMKDLRFAWKVVKHVKSNAIVYAKNQMTLGIGSGQTSRVFSATIASLKAKQAGFSLEGAVMASDAFFPFADGLLEGVQAGITAVIQPGGSKADADIIEAADKAGNAMVLTGIRHFKH